MIVADASVVIDVLLGMEPQVSLFFERIGAEAESIAAPYLLDAEVAQVLRRFVHQNKLEPGRAGEALEDYAKFPIVRYPHLPFLSRAFELRDRATIYDSLYISLAEALDALLITRDRALADIPGHRARVELI